MTNDQPTSDFGKFRTAISRQWVVRSTSCLVLGRGFRGRRIECRYFRLNQIQDGGWKISNGHISAMDQPIDFVFDSRLGFRGRWIEWTYFRSYQIQDSAECHLGKFQTTISLECVIRSTFMNYRAALEEYRRQ